MKRVRSVIERNWGGTFVGTQRSANSSGTFLRLCTEEIRHEGLVGHRSALRSRNVRHDPDHIASNVEWSRAECRSCPGLLWALPPSSPPGGLPRPLLN